MSVRLHNTLSGTKEAFVPNDPKRVTMYVCGPTVYNHAHIGNFRPVVVFDVLYRLLRYQYGEEAVIFARNFTDIDDKIIKAAQETGKSIGGITQHFTKVYQDESAALGALPPTLQPNATAHIADMIALIDILLEREIAYIAENHVIFDITKYDAYGELSNVNHDDMIAGARVEVAPYKRNSADFILWKPAKAGEPGWDTPGAWQLEGPGRPGWHLECSAMIKKTLGTTIDIHGGGLDLRFPHHENEIAQSVCAHGKPLARYWLHNGFLAMGTDKMSKSLGNIILVRDLLKQWPGEVIRFALLSAHYRQPLEWSDALLEQSKTQLDRFYRILMDHPETKNAMIDEQFIDALSDDMNTPLAISRLHALRDPATLKVTANMMGLLTVDPKAWFQAKMATDISDLSDGDIERLLSERTQAKKARDFARADSIRDELQSHGIIIEDSPAGTTWRR